MNIFYFWWTIINIKTPFKGCWLRNKYCNPLRVNDEYFGIEFLEEMANQQWKFALLWILTNYCIEELKMLYILAGKFQTDHLET